MQIIFPDHNAVGGERGESLKIKKAKPKPIQLYEPLN